MKVMISQPMKNRKKIEIIENILLGIGIVFIYDLIFLLWFIK